MKKTKHTLIKGVALLLAAMMAFGDPVSAMAAVPETTVTIEDAVTDASDTDNTVEALGADTLGAQTEDEYHELSDETKQALIDAAATENTQSDVEIEEPKFSEEILMKLGDDPSESTDTPEPSEPSTPEEPDTPKVTIPDPKPIGEGDVEVFRYSNRIVIKNKASKTGAEKDYENDLYGVVVLSGKENKIFLPASKIPVGESKSLYSYYDENYIKKEIDSSTDYELWLGRVNQGVDENDQIYQYDESFIGYRVVLDEDFNEVKVDNKTQYTEFNKLRTISLPRDKVETEPAIGWEDGYTGITMKAAVQKNMSIKITWAPNAKKAEKQKDFKKYELYELTPDGTNEETGYDVKRVWPVTGTSPAAKKSAVIPASLTEDKKIKSSMIYLLKCYDATGTNVLGQYVTTVAPYLFRLQSGYNTGDFDFMFTEPACNDDMSFKMAVAANKKDKADNNPNGFQDAWSSVMECENLMGYEIGMYPINKTTSVSVVEGMYGDHPNTMIGVTYYGRVQTVAHIGSLTVASVPSNILNCKAGPEKCFVMAGAGIKYDNADANSKTNPNAKNLVHANAFINNYFDPTENPIDYYEDMIHADNTNVDVKSGMIFFLGPDNMDNIKAFDLLRCNTPNGTFKKVKTYKLTDKTLLHCNVKGWDGINVYAMQYNNFPYEQDYYYAVRAVSSIKSASGGLGTAEYVVPQFECVRSASANESDASSIFVTWLHDDCVKEYWIYRSKTEYGGKREICNEKELVGKVSGKSTKTLKYDSYDDEGNITPLTLKYHEFNDKKVEVNEWYFYYVRPVYDTKAAKSNIQKYMEYSSEEYPARASATFQTVKNFKASNYATGQIRNSFTQVKNINEYKIWRTEVSSNVKTLTDDMKPQLFKEMKDGQSYKEFVDELGTWSDEKWTEYFKQHGGWVLVKHIKDTNLKSTASMTTESHPAVVGKYYFYMIQPIADTKNESGEHVRTVGTVFTYSSRIRNMPLPVENIKAGYNGSGVYLSWNMNANDKNNSDLGVQIRYDGGSWRNASRTGYYDDTLPRGGQRTYYVRVRYSDSDYYSEERSITYSLPIGIEVSKGDGDGTFKDNVLELEVDQTVTMGARAYLNNNQTASYNDISYSYNTGHFELTGSGNNFTVKANSVGTSTVTLTCAGIKKTFTIKVKAKSVPK